MKKIKIAFLVVLFFVFSSSASAQLVDIMSNLAIEGQITAQSAGQVKTALNMVQENKILNNLNLVLMDLKTSQSHTPSYQPDLAPLTWKTGVDGQKKRYFELNDVPESTCQKIKSVYQNQMQIQINGQNNAVCISQKKNRIKFIF